MTTDNPTPIPTDPAEFYAPRELVHNILDTIPDGLFAVDPDRKIVFWNRSMEEISGFTSEEVLGRSCDLLEGDACLKEGCNPGSNACSLFEDGLVRGRRCRLRRKDGRRITVVKNGQVLTDEDGEIVGGIESVTDISSVIQLEQEIAQLRRETSRDAGYMGIVGKHPRMMRLYDLIRLAGASRSSVLIHGETGTGKELVASAIHQSSERRSGPFVRVSCAALSEGLLESELFGHVRGAFTGAVQGRVGRFEAANGGTLFLDEIGDISMQVQTKLLRVLQEREFERVGSNRTTKVDIRVIAATNKDLLQLCEQGVFRRDLYYRLAVIPIRVPNLRERNTDIPLLVEHLLSHIAKAQGHTPPRLAPRAMECLASYRWPGNVRELENSLEYASVLAKGEVIDETCLPPSVLSCDTPTALFALKPHTRRSRRPDPEIILRALEHAHGHRDKTAAALGVSRMTLWKWMRDLELTWPPSPQT